MSRIRALTVLVYHADEAGRYAALVRAPRGRVTVHVAAKPEDAAAVIRDVDVLYAWKFPPPLYRDAPRLRWLQAMAAGVEWALVPELPSRVTVTRAPGIFGPWMAEYALGWMLWVSQRMAQYREAQRERRWIGTVMPDRLRGKTLAVVGLGDIGRAIARAASALGMRVVGVSRSGRAVPGIDRVWRLGGLARALGAADVVVLAVPLTRDTRGLVDARALGAMRESAWLVNVARGPIVVEDALVRALAERRIGGAVLDVFDEEPLPASHPLWDLPNAVVTPHISGPSTPDEIAPVFNDNLSRFLAGRPLRHVVDRRRGY
ncbi:MAG: D-2-hydroxyacid dehydrogenase [Candidatus Rokubacteria bacterium]|nr:D-2-hydroxyacid dehydrogenase [Candidatus Rokubacteria bacterium]